MVAQSFLTRCQKPGQTFRNGSLFCDPTQCLVEGIQVNYPLFQKTISFLVKSILPDLSSLEGHHELGFPNLLIKNPFPFFFLISLKNQRFSHNKVINVCKSFHLKKKSIFKITQMYCVLASSIYYYSFLKATKLKPSL